MTSQQAAARWRVLNKQLDTGEPSYDLRWQFGDAFEEYFVARMRELGRDVHKIEGREHQLRFGDTTSGHEIKCDRQFKRDSKYLFIETKERRQQWPHAMVESGIYRNMVECPFYAIGNLQHIYVYTKKQLRAHFEKYKCIYRIVEEHRFNGEGSGQGFRLEPGCLPSVEEFHWPKESR